MDGLRVLCEKGEYLSIFKLYSQKQEFSEEKSTSRGSLSSLEFGHFNRPLHYAAAQGDLDAVRVLIERFNCDAKCSNRDGVTPLHCASHGGHMDVIEYLVLERGCDPCVVDYRRSTPLHYVTCCAQYKSLVSASKKPDHDYFIPKSVIWMCAGEPSEGHVKSARLLIQQGCDPFKRNKKRKLPMVSYLMCRCGSLCDFEFIMGQEVRIPPKVLSHLLMIACEFEQPQIVERLLAESEGFTYGQLFFEDSFRVACMSGSLEVIKLFIDSGKYIPNITFILNTLKNGHFLFSDEVMECILKASGCHPCTKVHEDKLLISLFFPVACTQSYLRVVKTLLVAENFICEDHDKNTLLHLACTKRNLEVVKLLVKECFNQDAKNVNGKLPLHIACEQNHLEIAQLVSSQKGLTLNCEDSEGNTPLHIACHTGNAELVHYLTHKKQCNQNIQNKKQQLPLHFACERGSVKLASLVSYELDDVNIKNMDGNTPLHIACHSGDNELIRYLTQHKHCDQNIQNKKQQLPLHIVCKCGNTKLAKLVSSQEDININVQDMNGNTPLHIACSNLDNTESLSLVKHLVLDKRSRANVVNSKGDLPLHLALSSFPLLSVELVEALAQDVNICTKSSSGDTPLHIACKQANVEAVWYIIDCDEMIYADLQIHFACKSSDDIELLTEIATNENVNVTNSDGDTPLHIACRNNNMSAIEHLLVFHPDTLKQNLYGELPLHIACSKSLEMVKLIQTESVVRTDSVNETSQRLRLHHMPRTEDYSPLQIACKYGKVEIVQYLIEKEQFSRVQQNGDNLLHVACRYGSTDVVQYLINNNHCKVTASNELPLHLACSHGHIDVIKCLTKCQIKGVGLTQRSFTNALLFVVEKVDKRSIDVIKYLVTCNANPLALSNGKSLLDIACKCNDLELMKALTTCDVDLCDNKGNTPLHYACEYSCYDFASYLIERYCEQSVQNKQQSLALHIACHKSPKITFLLEMDKQKVTVEDENGNTPLHLACQVGSVATVQKLLQTTPGCKFKINKEGHSPLQLACNEALNDTCKLKIAEALVEYDPTLADSKAVHIACSQGNIDLLKVLVNPSNINSVNSTGKTLLHVASEQRHYSMICWLINHGADCTDSIRDDDGNSPLHVAISTSRQSLEAVMALGNSLILVQNKDGNTPVHIACQKFAVDVLNFFSKCAMFHKALSLKNNEGCTPLHIIVEQSLSKTVFRLFINADCNIGDDNGNTPLHIACDTDHIFNVKRLLHELGCKPDKQNNDGDLPIHIASTHSLEMVKIVATSSELASVCNKAGDTPLHIACRCEQIDIAKYLTDKMKTSTDVPNLRKEYVIHTVCQLDKQSIQLFDLVIKHTSHEVLSKKDIDGNTPLHLACMRGHFTQVLRLAQTHPSLIGIQNNYGETPLHIACRLSKKFNYKFPMDSLTNCDPKSQINASIPKEFGSKPGDTPLHIACRTGKIKVIKYLIPSVTHNEAAAVSNHCLELPFHECCRNSKNLVEMILDVYPIDYNTQNINGDTGLHVATCIDQREIVEYLLEEIKCDPNIQNNEKDLPLHIACRKSNLKTVQLIGDKTRWYLVNRRNKLGNTPLHEAAKCEKKADYVDYLLKIGCKTGIKNKEGESPLHLACRNGTLCTVITLLKLTEDQALHMMVTKAGNTLLHEACANKYYFATPIVKELLKNPNVEPFRTVCNSDGDLPLHLACREHSLELIKLLTKSSKDVLCNPNKHGDTPLHEIFKRRSDRNFPNIIDYLLEQLEEVKCVEEAVNSKNNNGQTPLHCACSRGELKAVTALLEHESNPNIKDNQERPPLTVATSPEIIKTLLRYGADTQPLYEMHKSVILSDSPPPTPVKLLFIGDPGVGKTTLIQSLQNENNEVLISTPMGHTAGVIPTNFSSKKYGAVTMYDFAGQPEYYASHDAVIHHTIKNIPPIVLLLISLMDSDTKIKNQAHFWINFISERCAVLSDKAHVIIVGSHADKLRSQGKNPVKKIKRLQSLLEKEFVDVSLIFKGLLYMNCTLSHSDEINKLRLLCQKSVESLREKGIMHFTSHCFFVLLLETFKGEVAVTIDKITQAIEKAPEDSPFKLLPTYSKSVTPMCNELDTKGHIMFIKCSTDGNSDYVILDKVKLLHDVLGSLFAPSNFPQHRPLSYSTGVVPLSRLKEYYDKYDPDMLLTFLTRMEYCREVTDHNVLDCITSDELTSETDRYFFFPHLVSLDRPKDKWNEDSDVTYKFGWLLQCSRDGNFFSPHFIQALLLRLAFAFALKPQSENNYESDSEFESDEDGSYDDHEYEETNSSEEDESSDDDGVHHMAAGESLALKVAIKRICSVWKNGIYWQDNDGVTAIVDIVGQKNLIVLMQCKRGSEVECIKRRSSVMSMVFETKEELCPRAKFFECFLRPDSVKHPLTMFNELYKTGAMFSIHDIERTINMKKPFIVNNVGYSIKIEQLLYFEPYSELPKQTVINICNHTSTNKPTEKVLHSVADSLYKRYHIFHYIINDHLPPDHNIPEASLICLLRKASTFQVLRKWLDQISIFNGRKPPQGNNYYDEYAHFLTNHLFFASSTTTHFWYKVKPSSWNLQPWY